MRKLECRSVSWPAKGEFRISRSTLTEFPVVQVRLTEGGHVGRAECRPYARYNETTESVTRQILAIKSEIESGLSNTGLQNCLPAGAARNAVDCALWNLRAKKAGSPVWKLAELPEPRTLKTAFTLSIDTPAKMAEAARNADKYKLLKVKIGDGGGIDACRAILAARPDATLIVDANEALSPNGLRRLISLNQEGNIALIEQPFHASTDHAGQFDGTALPLICADESLHTHEDLKNLWDVGYRAVNVKLDKTGGLTEAITVIKTAQDMGFKIMAGCMVGSSLAMAPMVILASMADYVDLDGPLLLGSDIDNPIRYDGDTLYPPDTDLWG